MTGAFPNGSLGRGFPHGVPFFSGASGIAPPPSLSGLTLATYYDPRTGTFSDTGLATPAGIGEAVAGWQDLTGGGASVLQSVSSKRPVLHLSSTGQRVLRFDGLDDYMVSGSVSSISQPFTIATIVTLRSNTVSATARILRQVTNFSVTTTQNFYAAGMSAGVTLNFGTFSLNTPTPVVCVFNNTASVGRLDGIETAGSASSGGAGGVIAVAAVESGLTGYAPIDVGPVLRYAGGADAAQRATLTQWLRAAYGI